MHLLDFALAGVNSTIVNCTVSADVKSSTIAIIFDYFGQNTSLEYDPGRWSSWCSPFSAVLTLYRFIVVGGANQWRKWLIRHQHKPYHCPGCGDTRCCDCCCGGNHGRTCDNLHQETRNKEALYPSRGLDEWIKVQQAYLDRRFILELMAITSVSH